MILLRRHSGKLAAAVLLALALGGVWLGLVGSRAECLEALHDQRQPFACLSSRLGPVMSLAFCKDGKTLFSGYGEGKVVLWDVVKQSSVQSIGFEIGDKGLGPLAPPGYETIVVASPASEDLLAVCSTQLKFFEKKDNKWALKTIKGERDLFGQYPLGVRSFAVSPDGSYLALGLVLRGGFAIERKESEPPPSTLQVRWSEFRLVQLLDSVDREIGLSTVHSVAFSPDSKLLAVGTESRRQSTGAVHLIEPSTGRIRNTLSIPARYAHRVAFSPDGRFLACAGKEPNPDKSSWEGELKKEFAISLWDVNTGKPLDALTGHKASVLSLAFSPDGKYLATCSEDKTRRIWNIEQKRAVATIDDRSTRVLTFSPDGKLLATGQHDSNIMLWDFAALIRE
jgi:WD40 repeat protein